MPKVDIWMPIYIGDYLRDTVELSAEEHGAYVLLLMHYWQKNGEIGSDVDRLSRVARVNEKTCSFILGYYFELIDGNYRNKRADEEMENAANRRNAASENGKKGGRPPINNPEKSDGLPAANLTPNPQESSSSSSSSSDKEKEKIIPPSAVAEVEVKTKAVAKVKKESDPLYTAIFESFIGKCGAFTNYPKEAQAIKRIIKYCEQHAKMYSDGDKIKLAELVITRYYELTKNGDRFWRGQPFTPSNLSAPGIFDRVLVEIGQRQKEGDNVNPFEA
jgi:uncharacterized protein YdaU (DUF1376 family)